VLPVVIIAASAWRSLPLLPQQATPSVQKSLSLAVDLIAASRPHQQSGPHLGDRAVSRAHLALQQLCPLLSCPRLPPDAASASTNSRHRQSACQQSLTAWSTIAEAACAILTPCHDEAIAGGVVAVAAWAHHLLMLPAQLLQRPCHGTMVADDTTLLQTSTAWSSVVDEMARC
jgi:hypothetical protein